MEYRSMEYRWIPFDLTRLLQEQQDNMYMAWLLLVAAELDALEIKAAIVVAKKGDPGPLTTNLQGSLVWINNYAVQQLIAFNDFFDNTVVNVNTGVKRNDPRDYAMRLVSRAVELDNDFRKGTLGAMAEEVLPWPDNPDISVHGEV